MGVNDLITAYAITIAQPDKHCLTFPPECGAVDLWDSIDGELRGVLSEEFGPAAARGATHKEVMRATLDPADSLCNPLQWKSRAFAPGKEEIS